MSGWDIGKRSAPLDVPAVHLYNVHMKRVTASEARRLWFRLLDQVLDGEVVVISRRGKRIVIRREEEAGSRVKLPDYSRILQVREPDAADTWGWDWPGPEQDVVLREETDG